LFCYGFFLNGAAARVHARNPEKYVPEAFSKLEPKGTGLCEPMLFQLPLIRHFLKAMGCADPASKGHMAKLMKNKVPIGLLPGDSSRPDAT
jgi:hypothetical protein